MVGKTSPSGITWRTPATPTAGRSSIALTSASNVPSSTTVSGIQEQDVPRIRGHHATIVRVSEAVIRAPDDPRFGKLGLHKLLGTVGGFVVGDDDIQADASPCWKTEDRHADNQSPRSSRRRRSPDLAVTVTSRARGPATRVLPHQRGRPRTGQRASLRGRASRPQRTRWRRSQQLPRKCRVGKAVPDVPRAILPRPKRLDLHSQPIPECGGDGVYGNGSASAEVERTACERLGGVEGEDDPLDDVRDVDEVPGLTAVLEMIGGRALSRRDAKIAATPVYGFERAWPGPYTLRTGARPSRSRVRHRRRGSAPRDPAWSRRRRTSG